MPQASLNCFQETANFVVTGWNLHTHELVALLVDAVGLAVVGVVDIAGHVLGKPVADVAELFVVPVDFVWVVAVGTLARV